MMMTREERDNLIYYWVDECNWDKDLTLTGNRFRMLKKDINWRDHLFPDEKAKYEAMSDIDQLMISISCDPINALNLTSGDK